MSFGQRLKSARIERGYTQKELGAAVGVTEMTVGNWERGVKAPGLPALIVLSDKLGVSIDFLAEIKEQNLFGAGAYSSRREKLLLDRYRSLDVFGRKAVDSICEIEYMRAAAAEQKKTERITRLYPDPKRESERYIPYYMTPSAAGFAIPLEGDEFEMLLADDSVPEDADYAVRIQGDSMCPYIDDGEMVFVKKDRAPSVGDVGIFCVDGAMYCKQYYKDSSGNVCLLSANPDRKDASIYLSSDCGSTVTSCGTVIMKSIPLPDYLHR